MLIKCLRCNAKLKVPDAAVGKKVRCPKCSTIFSITGEKNHDEPQPQSTQCESLTREALPPSKESGLADQLDVSPTASAMFGLRFIQELDQVHRRLFERNDPRACLPILTERFEKRRAYLQRFCTDLARLVDLSDTSPKRFLPTLVHRFAQWRSDTESQIAGFLQTLPQDDPLRCAISLFGTMDYGRLERAHTKTLAWLLNPSNEEHEFGPALLRVLLRFVENDLFDQLDFDAATVVAERRLESGDRIDIFVEGRIHDESGVAKKCYLIVEAKIDAVEGADQAAKYEDWIDVYLAPSPVIRVFLTPDRRAPMSTGAPELWKRLSFMDLAILFRQELARLHDKAGYHFLRHYLTGIFKDIYRWKLPIRDSKQCVDPYGFLAYVAAIPNDGGRSK